MNWFANAFRMPLLFRSATWALLAAVLFGAFSLEGRAQVKEQKETPEAPLKEKKEKKEKKKKKNKSKSEEMTFDLPIPIGHGANGIKLPDRDAEGNLRMNFEIGSAFRVDEINLKLENLKIESFDETGKLDMVIEMPESSMDLKTRILTSVNPVTIHRSDFELTGGNMTFNTKTRQGKFSGPVRMLIFNRDDLDSAKKEKGEVGE